MKFIHLSDLHFHRSPNDNREATTTLEFINSNYPSHYLLVTGDITDDGDSTQYNNAWDALSAFNGRIYICPGNHDFGAAGNFYEKSRAERFDHVLAGPLGQQGTCAGATRPVVNLVTAGNDQALIIALDSNLETLTPFDFACGKIGEMQLQALDQILTSYAGCEAKKILLLHHHPFLRDDPFMKLQDAEQLWATVYHRIDVMCFGHKHVWGEWFDYEAVPIILASDNSPGKNFAHEITVTASGASAATVPISPQVPTTMNVRSAKPSAPRRRTKK